MASIRKTAWFVATACVMALWMGALGSLRGEAVAGVIASRGTEAGAAVRSADLEKVQAFLERKIVRERLRDYGVSPAEAMAKAGAMSDRDIHRLAALEDRIAAGSGGDVFGFVIGIAILAILVALIFKLLDKEIIIR